MTRSHDDLVQHQFGPQAQAYVDSAVHASGEDLDALQAIAARLRPDRALDLGSGGGHVAYRLAGAARSVTACDLSARMMEAVAAQARDRGLSNIDTCVAPAEALPFADESFDFLACRFSAHHWRDFDGGLREARRVVKRGSTALFIDLVSPGPAALDTHLQAVELLRDPSHVRDYSVAEWTAALTRAGFRIEAVRMRRLRMDYPSWVDRMRTSDEHRVAIRSLQRLAVREIVNHFCIETNGSFTADTAQIELTAV